MSDPTPSAPESNTGPSEMTGEQRPVSDLSLRLRQLRDAIRNGWALDDADTLLEAADALLAAEDEQPAGYEELLRRIDAGFKLTREDVEQAREQDGGGSYVRLSRKGPAEDEQPAAPAVCTGLTATWCPIHGDCTCPRRESDGDVDFADDFCPLHNMKSTHADRPAAPVDEQPASAELRDVVRMAIESLKGHGLDSIRDSLKDALDTEYRP